MDLLADIGVFLLFLLELGAFLFASFRLTKYLQGHPARMLSFYFSQLVILLAITHVALTLLLLARVFSLVLLGLLLAAYEFGAIVGYVSRAVIGSGIGRSWLIGAEMGVRHQRLLLLGGIAMALVNGLAYPIMAAIAYFSLEKGSDDLVFWVIALTAGTVLTGLLLLLALNAVLLLGMHVDEGTRTLAFVGQLMSIPQPALWLAIAYWASKRGDSGAGIDRSFVFLTGALIVFMLLLSVGPYLVGAARARRRRTELLSREQAFWKRLAEAAEMPMSPGYRGELVSLDEDVDAATHAFEAENGQFFALLDELTKPDLREALGEAGLVLPSDKELEAAEAADGRVLHKAALKRIDDGVDELLAEPDQGAADQSRELAAGWHKRAVSRSEEAEQTAAKVHSTANPILRRAAFGLFVTPVVSVVVDQFALSIWDELSTLPH